RGEESRRPDPTGAGASSPEGTGDWRARTAASHRAGASLATASPNPNPSACAAWTASARETVMGGGTGCDTCAWGDGCTSPYGPWSGCGAEYPDPLTDVGGWPEPEPGNCWCGGIGPGPPPKCPGGIDGYWWPGICRPGLCCADGGGGGPEWGGVGGRGP